MTILDAAGLPMKPASKPGRRMRAGLASPGGARYPYDAGNPLAAEGSDWNPPLRPGDAALVDRQRIVARSQDLVRNDGWASGTIQTILDETVGLTFRLSAKPDYRALQRLDRRLDATWAAEYAAAAEAEWRMHFVNDPLLYGDVSQRMTIEQQFWISLRHRLVEGDAIAVAHFMPERQGPGGARYATAIRLVHPQRLCNPMMAADSRYLRDGVEIDDHDVPIAYHFRKGDPGAAWIDPEAMEWERVTREVAGWRRVFHSFDALEIGQNRGVGILTPVVNRLKMLIKYDSAELQAAIVNAIFATFITSPFDTDLVQAGLDDGGGELGAYQRLRDDFHEGAHLMLGNARLPHLFPGEKLESVGASRPGNGFDAFEHAMLRNVAAQTGNTAEQLSKDWSKTNYSSARGALLTAWKTMVRRRRDFALSLASPIYASFLWELHDYPGRLPMPAGAPPFEEARAGYAACRWIGPGRGWIDPTKEREGAVLGMEAGLSTLEDEAAENGGADWEEVIDQRAREVAAFKARGLTPPSWAGPSKDPGLMAEGQKP